jgi:hypothetical protein
MSVMKPGVTSSVPPTTISTPSTTSRPGKRRCASASLKRRQAPSSAIGMTMKRMIRKTGIDLA